MASSDLYPLFLPIQTFRSDDNSLRKVVVFQLQLKFNDLSLKICI